MRKLFFCLAIIICLMLIIPPTSGCSETENENTFGKLLSLLPETAKEGRVVTIIDYERFRQVNGILIYNEDNQRINREEYYENIVALDKDGSLFGYDIIRFSSYWTGCGAHILRSPIQHESIGYEATDVDAEINNIYSLSALPWILGSNEIAPNPDAMIAATGDFDQQATNDALENLDEWPLWAIDKYTNEQYKDIIIHSWGDSLEFHFSDRFSPPHLDQIGRAMPLAVSDRLLFIGSYVDHIKSMIEAMLDETSSLADLPEYVLVSQGMYDLGAIGVLIMDEAHTRDILLALSPRTGPRIRDFLTVGVGPGRDEKGEYVALVLVYKDNTEVKDGVSIVEEKIEAFNNLCEESEYGENDYIYDAEICTEGRVLLAKLYTENQNLWRYWFFNQWGIIHSEELPGN